MRPSPSTDRCRVLVLFLLPASLVAQTSSLPPSSSTVPMASRSVPATPAKAHGAEVTYTDGLLTVSATDAGLRGIVLDIARRTGMHVSGSVPDLPVFGTYGPAAPSAILATLLEGTGSNILLVDATATTPAQLTLTRRNVTVTPPNPNASVSEEADSNGLQSQPSTVPPPPAPNPGQDGANPVQPTSTVQSVVFPPVGTTTIPSTATTSPSDPDQPANNGVKTPQQIFEQLQRLRQQQTQTGSPVTP